MTQRKSLSPERSIIRSTSKSSTASRGIIKLDVYSLYLKNPSQLLSSQSLLSPPVLESSDTEALTTLPKRRGRQHHPRAQPLIFHTVKLGLDEIPQCILDDDQFSGMTQEEIDALSFLKVTHSQYIKARNSLVIYNARMGQVKKRDAGKLCKMDVNKSGKLFDHFLECNWLI